MPLKFSDLFQYDWIRCADVSEIPHEQGIYLLFDQDEDIIYVGKGFGDERVPIHFNPNADEGEYFSDAYYWFWLQTDDECLAEAYEKAIYDSILNVTGKPPKHNCIRPAGYKDISQTGQNALKQKPFIPFMEYVQNTLSIHNQSLKGLRTYVKSDR